MRLIGQLCDVHAVEDMLRSVCVNYLRLNGYLCAVHAVADRLISVCLTRGLLQREVLGALAKIDPRADELLRASTPSQLLASYHATPAHPRSCLVS